MTSPPIYVGIDVAKDHLDVAALPSNEAWRVTNDPDGIDAPASRLTAAKTATRTVSNTLGRQIARGLLGSLGGSRR